MVTIQVKGRITEDGKLEVDLPTGVPSREVQVTIEIAAEEEELPWELRPWTTQELAELSKSDPMTGAEIVAWLEQEGGWEDNGISGAEWVEEVRRKERERRGW
jgi:hypothetical protein